MNSLYELTNKILEFYYNQDEFSPSEKIKVESELNSLIKNKSANIIAVIRDKELLVDNIDTEIKRLQQLKKSIVNKTENLKEMTKDQLTRLGKNRLETGLGTLSIRKSPISIEIIDEDKISKAFKKEKTIVTVDKIAIKKHFQETGEIIEGVKVNYDKTSLQIRWKLWKKKLKN